MKNILKDFSLTVNLLYDTYKVLAEIVPILVTSIIVY